MRLKVEGRNSPLDFHSTAVINEHLRQRKDFIIKNVSRTERLLHPCSIVERQVRERRCYPPVPNRSPGLLNFQNRTTWDIQASVLEALAASGLRSIRYALELDADLVKEIVANDISKSAVESIKKNADLNSVGNKVRPNLGDAILYMHQSKAESKYFDVVGKSVFSGLKICVSLVSV